MTEVPSAADRTALEAIVQRLAAAWNAGDAAAYAALLASDADFVNVRAEHLTGRAAIAAAHDAIFRSFYAESTVRLVVQSLRFLVPDVALLHVAATDRRLPAWSHDRSPRGPDFGRVHARSRWLGDRRIPQYSSTRSRRCWVAASRAISRHALDASRYFSGRRSARV